MRHVWALLQIVLPWPIKRRIGKAFFGWDVHPTAFIGRSVVIVKKLTMGPGAVIGPQNAIKFLEELSMGESASIGSRNKIIGFPPGTEQFKHLPNRNPSLVMGRFAVLTVGHEVDCSDRVELGDFASVGGFNTTILTHSLDLVRNRFGAGPVLIGERSAVMSNCMILSGNDVPARSVVSAGSVINTKLTKELTFYRGNPAEAVRELPPTLKFFTREGHVGAN